MTLRAGIGIKSYGRIGCPRNGQVGDVLSLHSLTGLLLVGTAGFLEISYFQSPQCPKNKLSIHLNLTLSIFLVLALLVVTWWRLARQKEDREPWTGAQNKNGTAVNRKGFEADSHVPVCMAGMGSAQNKYCVDLNKLARMHTSQVCSGRSQIRISCKHSPYKLWGALVPKVVSLVLVVSISVAMCWQNACERNCVRNTETFKLPIVEVSGNNLRGASHSNPRGWQKEIAIGANTRTVVAQQHGGHCLLAFRCDGAKPHSHAVSMHYAHDTWSKDPVTHKCIVKANVPLCGSCQSSWAGPASSAKPISCRARQQSVSSVMSDLSETDEPADVLKSVT